MCQFSSEDWHIFFPGRKNIIKVHILPLGAFLLFVWEVVDNWVVELRPNQKFFLTLYIVFIGNHSHTEWKPTKRSQKQLWRKE